MQIHTTERSEAHMAGEDRRKKILQLLKGQILNGSQLAEQLNVSRQAIVQDIALLRTSGHEILSTRQGYILSADNTCTRTYHVRCPEDEIESMLNVFVDAGGTVQDIFVIHNTYGVIRAELHLCNRREVKQFIESIHTGREAALRGLCKGGHWHTVSADGESALDLIQQDLRAKGYLIESPAAPNAAGI